MDGCCLDLEWRLQNRRPTGSVLCCLMLSLWKSSKEEEIHDEQWLRREIIVRVMTVFSEVAR